MEQLTQKLKNGEIKVVEVPTPLLVILGDVLYYVISELLGSLLWGLRADF